MKALLILTMLTAAMASGQPRTPEPREAATIPVTTLTGDSFDRLIRLLGVFDDARINGDSQLRTIAVYAPKDVVVQIRRLVESLDKPGSEAAIGRNIEMTLTFLRCSPRAAATPSPLPPDIEPVAKQLRAATQYKDIQVWDTVPLHVQEGREATQNMRLPGSVPGVAAAATAQIRIRAESIGRKPQGRYVRFGTMRVDFRVPIPTGTFKNGNDTLVNTQFSYTDVGINTAGDFMEGQKTVLGKVSALDEDGAIFVVVALKILD